MLHWLHVWPAVILDLKFLYLLPNLISGVHKFNANIASVAHLTMHVNSEID